MATPKSGKTAPVKLDHTEVEKLASIGCTYVEMAHFFNCSTDTLSRNYADQITAGREKGKVSLRRLMWQQGHNGNSVALKYLVHNLLKEKIEDSSDKDLNKASSDVLEKLSSISTDMLLKLVKNEDKVG